MTMVALINNAMLRAVMAVGELRARMAEEAGATEPSESPTETETT